MKRFILLLNLIFFLSTILSMAQNDSVICALKKKGGRFINGEEYPYNDLAGKAYNNPNEINAFKNFIYLDEKTCDKLFYCYYYLDTISFVYTLVCTKKVEQNPYQNLIIDILYINNLKENQYVRFGCVDLNSNLKDQIIVAIEKEKFLKVKITPRRQRKFIKAWMFNSDEGLFMKMDIKELYRINDVYYKKSRYK